MLTISARQRAILSEDVDARQVKALADHLLIELRAQANDVLKAYDDDNARSIILDVIGKCRPNEILDPTQILNLCYIRLILNADVFTNEAFSYVFTNSLLHPFAKARHLILSFFAISAMRARS